MHAAPATVDITSPFTLSQEQIAAYQRDGAIKLSQVLSAASIAAYRGAIAEEVRKRSVNYAPIAERGTYGKAFLQIMNLFLENEVVKEFVFSPRLARIAAELMQVDGVRLYHDQALFKEAGGGATPWHVDQQYWPLDSHETITAWIPLVPVSMDMGPLSFALGSHRLVPGQALYEGRELAISDESEAYIGKTVKDFPEFVEPFALGDVTFHAGWTFHRANANKTSQMREVMTMIYLKDGMKVHLRKPGMEPERDNWMPGIEAGQVIDSPKNPLLWKR